VFIVLTSLHPWFTSVLKTASVRIVSFNVMADVKKFSTTASQKMLLIVSGGVFVIFAALIASLPLNMPGRQDTESTSQKGTENLDNGDTAWIIIATIFGFVTGPAVSYSYGEFWLFSVSITAPLLMMLCFIYHSEYIWQRREQDCAGVAHYVCLHHHAVDNYDVSFVRTTAPFPRRDILADNKRSS
jgi:hypothetical protein